MPGRQIRRDRAETFAAIIPPCRSASLSNLRAIYQDLESFTKTYQPWVAMIAIVGSLWIGYVQFLQSRHEQTVSRVFDMSKEYRANFLDVSLTFSDKWKKYLDGINDMPEGNFVSGYDDLVEAFLDQPGTRLPYEKLGSFYNALGVCVRANLCDFETAKAIFGDYVLSYYHNMYPDLQLTCQHGSEADGIFYLVIKMNYKALGCQNKNISLPVPSPRPLTPHREK